MDDHCSEQLQEGYAVVGGYISPVNDAYKKPGLLSSQHRIQMCQLAATDSDLVMVDTWEAAQAEAQRSLIVLKRIQHAAQKYYKDDAADTDAQQGEGWQQDDQSRMNSGSKAANSDINAYSKPRRHIGTQVHRQNCNGPSFFATLAISMCLCDSAYKICSLLQWCTTSFLSARCSHVEFTPAADQWLDCCQQVKSVLVCGADVLESFIKPGVWVEDQVRQILGDHGVVCIAR